MYLTCVCTEDRTNRAQPELAANAHTQYGYGGGYTYTRTMDTTLSVGTPREKREKGIAEWRG